ncbi:hypothetical protein QAD02_013644 [Eretmocerus hayati]|uniref:Uncharacterized protein n=1 Tax=Eretmocerus hayati TaxID=131215 RepID=A0ACC2P388_9HYME|nr:hypothetical protein QAD02_013644 [Eretmocerus hayati]
MSNRSGDRHKAPRFNMKSGSEKEKIRQEKQRHHEEIVSKSRRMTDFLKIEPTNAEANIPTSEGKIHERQNGSDDQRFRASLICHKPSDERSPNCNGTQDIPADSTCAIIAIEELDASKLSSCDISEWPDCMSDSQIDFLIRRGCSDIQFNDPKLLDAKSFIQK